MSADLSASSYLVDGVDVAATGVELTHDGAGLWSGVSEGITTSVPPGTDGADITGGTFPPFTHSTMYSIDADGFDSVWAAIRALRRRCKPGRTVTLTRTMPDPEGTDTNTSQTATARRIADRITWEGPNAADIDIDWLVTSGFWLGPSEAIASASGTQTVKGDIRTHAMTITLAAGAARTLTNSTNGHAFTFSTTVPAGGVLIDVEARTAVAITGGADMSRYLSWTKFHPMLLEDGANVFVLSTGAASIAYQPAYQ